MHDADAHRRAGPRGKTVGIPDGSRPQLVEVQVRVTQLEQARAPLDEGLEMFRRSIQRLEKTPPPMPSPVFGPMTHDEWKRLAMRHAELHLSFFKPR